MTSDRRGAAQSPALPEALNIADRFLDQRIIEGRGDRIALRLEDGDMTFSEVRALADRFGLVLRNLGVRQEERVLIALRDGADYVGALFGALKIGAVVVMVNPDLKPETLATLFDYSRAAALVVAGECLPGFAAASLRATWQPRFLVVGADGGASHPVFTTESQGVDGELRAVETHRDDPAMWLFSGGTTGTPSTGVLSIWAVALVSESAMLKAKTSTSEMPASVAIAD